MAVDAGSLESFVGGLWEELWEANRDRSLAFERNDVTRRLGERARQPDAMSLWSTIDRIRRAAFCARFGRRWL